MKVKITFTYFKDVEKDVPSKIFDHYQFIGRIIKEVERIEKEPRWSIEDWEFSEIDKQEIEEDMEE